MAAAAGICARRMQMYHAEGLSVRKIDYDVRITSVPASIRELRARGCKVALGNGVMIEGPVNSDIDVLRLWRDRSPDCNACGRGRSQGLGRGEFDGDRVVKLNSRVER